MIISFHSFYIEQEVQRKWLWKMIHGNQAQM